jgi:hypothetical protein
MLFWFIDCGRKDEELVSSLPVRRRNMLKFKFDYLNQTLAYQKPFETKYWYQITETFAGNFGSLGFQLEEG